MTVATAALTRYRRPHRKSRHHAAGAQFFPRISLTAANHTCIIHPSFLPAFLKRRGGMRGISPINYSLPAWSAWQASMGSSWTSKGLLSSAPSSPHL